MLFRRSWCRSPHHSNKAEKQKGSEKHDGCQDADIIFTHTVVEVCHVQHININVGICCSGMTLHPFSVQVEEGQGLY